MASHARGDRRTDDATDDGERDAASASLSKDDAFHILQNPRRRAVLRYLYGPETPARVDVTDLAAAVAALEEGTTPEELDADDRRRVYIALYQTHLPKLHRHDIVEYDRSCGTVALELYARALAPFLDDGLHASETVPVVTDASEERSADMVGGLLSTLGLTSE